MNKRCPKCNSANIYEVAFMCDIEDNKELWVFACDNCGYGGFFDEKIKCENCKDGYLEFIHYMDCIEPGEGYKTALYRCDMCLKDFITTIKINN